MGAAFQDEFRDIKTAFDRLADVPECRAIVLSGNGKSFCAGIDLQMGMGVSLFLSPVFQSGKVTI